MSTSPLPQTLADIRDDFLELEQQDRLLLLLEFANELPAIPAKYEGLIHAIGLILLLILMVFVTFGDIGRLLRGGW